MTYEEKKQWLRRYREAEKTYQNLSYRLAEAQAATRHITQNYSATPGGSRDGQNLARAVEREDEAERKAYNQLAVCDRLFNEIEAALIQVPVYNGYLILHKYYLNGLTWEQIATDLGLSIRWVHRLRRFAIEHLKL